ncbi:MAG: lysine--tRNA ligase [bacterium]
MIENERLEEQAVRLTKLERLREDGTDCFASTSKRSHMTREVLLNFEQLEADKTFVTVAGRIKTRRTHGAMTFLDLEDGSGQIQVALKMDHVGDASYTKFNELIDGADFIEVHGLCFVTKRGEKTIDCDEWKLLTKALLPLPEKWHGLTDTEVRYRKRYLDLIANKEVRDIFAKRSLIVKKIREVMDAHDFMEVETPILQTIAGGASARPFTTHHNTLDIDLYLRIAPELYLKRLIVGGFERVYEIARCFRNEGISFQHNPEFTQIEFYWAYASYEDLMKIMQELIHETVSAVTDGRMEVTRDEVVLNFGGTFPVRDFFALVKDRTSIDLDLENTEEKLRAAIISRKLPMKLDDVIGYGELVDSLYKEFVRPHIIQPTFVIDYPAQMKPLAKRKIAEPNKAAAIQLVVQGIEVINAYYYEQNDPIVQEQVFAEEQKTKERGAESAMSSDEDFIEALKHGMPPTAGFGMGIDRLCSLLLGTHSIKEVILFPTMRPEDRGQEIKKTKNQENKNAI